MDQFLSWLTGLFAAIVPHAGAAPEPVFLGYVEAQYVYVAAPSPGMIEDLAIAEGDVVKKGEVLFVLSHGQQHAQLDAAEARVAAAQASVDNLKTGSRVEDVDVIRASLMQAEAQLRQTEAQLGLAQASWTRSQELFAAGLIPKARLDTDKSAHDSAAAAKASAEAQVAQLSAQLEVAELPARDAQLANAEANLLAAEADAARARSDLADRTIVAPVSGRIETLFFTGGEIAATGVPVVELLPANAMEIKFYVGESERAGLALGDVLSVHCDGCADALTATLSHLAADPQFTPPVIYSRDERSRLVFLAQAELADADNLLPGQPVSVELAP
jgi:HlyD family secretion protein